jgi:two-component system phosphate regulon sensor histidine kinase PhoR
VSGAQARGGTGLGLAIVKHVLKRHDSELRIESALNEGSKFYCEFRPAQEDRRVAVENAI